ncbi:periplasmic oligopeptide-binding protein,putative' [Aggregatibacter actinomycetemcomitans HK1651]|nr:periplasmic oligopeptide-binding protein,putative' [Aggregatibacter actinomycetemcomitans HK1651]
MQQKLLVSTIALALSCSVYAAKVPEGTQLAETQNIVINNGSEPQSFDPHKTDGIPEAEVAYQLFEGLVTTDSDGNLITGVAESWENTPDYKTWTFHLRKDAKWSNGEPITANDFVFAWRRLVTPATASPYASFLDYLQVENAQDIIDGKKKPEELGVEAKDNYTFVVHTTNPVPYAVGLTTHQSLLPLPQKIVEKFGDDWVKKDNIVGNGAYKLKNHVINEKIEFERNPQYWNDKETQINNATFLAIENSSTDVARYRAGDLDITSHALPPE